MSKINQKEYLKRYLSTDDQLLKKKKKKNKEKKEKSIKTTVKIIDDNESAYTHQNDEIDESELYATNEEAPQIVGVVDERAPQVILKQEYQQSGKWKGLDSTSSNKESDRSKKEMEKNSNIRKYSSDASPPRFKEKNYDRKKEEKRRYSSDLSPPRFKIKNSKKRHSSDESPPRLKRNKNSDDSDQSPPRVKPSSSQIYNKGRESSDQSPPRKKEIKKEKRSRSKDRQKRKYSEDLSPPRLEIKRERSPSPHNYRRKSRWSREKSPSGSKMSKTLDGKASGLQNAQNLKVENEKHRDRQKKIFESMSADVSGKNADVVIRDRRGRNKEFEHDLEKEKKKMKAEEARQKVYDKWGKGLKQIEAAEIRRKEFEHEASKPLARSENDEDLQDYLKNQERLEDPMLMYMRKKKNEEKKSKGVLEKPIYQGDFPDNRFGIRPGYRWDGVDRSNGYEKKYFTMINSKKSLEEEAYRYSTEDM